MNKIIIFTAVLGLAAATPAYYFDHEDSHDLHVHSISSPSKTTITKTSNHVNHGGHQIVHVPVHEPLHLVHEPVHVVEHQPIHVIKHEPVHTLVHSPVVFEHKHVEPAKSSQYFKLENTVYKTPKVVAKVVSPVVPVVHAPVYHTPIVTRSGDSAVSHHSSYTHETEHEVKSLPLYALHH